MGEMADFQMECEPDLDWCEPDPPTTRSCRCCGASGLVWMRSGGRWLLGDGKRIHQCPVNPYAPKKKKETP